MKRDSHGVPIPIYNDKGHRVNLCWWFQTKKNGGHKCPRAQADCDFIHQPADEGKNEIFSVKRPRADSPAPKPKAKAKPKVKAKPKAKTKPKRDGTPPPGKKD